MRIAVIGLGFVAISDALALARVHDVVLTGPVPDRVDAINAGTYPLQDPSLKAYCQHNRLSVRATLDTVDALNGAELVMISAPLAASDDSGRIDTTELESRIEMAHLRCPGVPIVIRSAVPIGFTNRMRETLHSRAILYVPEFLRDGHSLDDALNPKSLIIGDRGALGSKVGAVFLSAAQKPGVKMRLMGACEAEAVKHFSQAYLAARIAYFNELDSYALAKGLNSRRVIDGVCLDPRIGTYANNPCFGYGGHRMPRSMSHLNAFFDGIPAHVLPCVTNPSRARIALLASQIMAHAPHQIGVYSPGGTAGANDPLAALRDRLIAGGARVRTYTGLHSGDAGDLIGFKADCDLILAQRITPELLDVRAKVFSRDLYAQG